MWNATKNRGEEGFLLVEVALVLIILGIILGPSFILFRNYQRFQQLQTTQKHQDIVFQSLCQYFSQYGHLPLPSYPECFGYKCADKGLSPSYVGIIPFRLLGLSEKHAKDGYNQWMTYAVDPRLTMLGNVDRLMMCTMVFKYPSKIKIQDGDVECVNAILEKQGKETKYDGIAVVLISHGPEKSGALIKRGERTSLYQKAGMCKKKNCQDLLSFCAFPQSNDEGINDDIVKWMTRGYLVKEAGLSCIDYFFPHWCVPLK